MKKVPPTKVFYEGAASKGTADLSTFGEGSGLNGLQKTAGGDNIAESLGTYPKVDWEWIITQNPEVIIKIYKSDKSGWDMAEKNNLQDVLDEIYTRPGAENISAIKNNRVYLLYNDIVYGMDCPVGLSYLTNILHPDAKLNPGEIYRQYLEMLSLKYPEGRIFVYPDA